MSVLVMGVVTVIALVVGVVVGMVVGPSIGVGATTDGPPAACSATAVAATGLPSVVTVAAQTSTGATGGTGSGVIVRPGGVIVTNDHVISPALNGGSLVVRYSNGRSSPAAVVGRDVLTDLAVLKAADQASGLPVSALGSSQNLLVGEPVVALGAPLGLVDTVTAGIVSALDREVAVPAADGQTAHLVGAIQTDAAINPGNSGGALVNCRAELIGVNTAIATVPNDAGEGGGGSVGLGFAIPVDIAMPIAEELISTGTVTHYTVGLQVQAVPAAIAEQLGLPGRLLVGSVASGGPADLAGLRPNDVITQVNGQPAASVEQITVAELGARSGRPVEIAYLRGATPMTVTLVAVRVQP
ncbi:S1C family serine protease [Pseudonocardia humida]|uniref:Trypsin-like peptidase domain-containing protein n=1 Tax=Pseudonocardia humida TaxID=2800819 RepID=A0ABT1A6Y5_9PSEU|nr:trypsin-like peptidase domain-containing protein [Pseudonocardia humida]MCO1658489.1 trypsin-like peptidase domain-containing protein [Pseudonocardia humida]